MKKYIEVEDLIKAFTDSNDLEIPYSYATIHELINLAKPMVPTKDIMALINKYKNYHDSYPTSVIINEFDNVMCNKQYGDFTKNEWIQLSKLVYVQINFSGKNHAYTLNNSLIEHYLERILSLAADPKNMERTNTDIPDGIEIEVTSNTGKVWGETTPYKLTDSDIHYRILGSIRVAKWK